MADSARPFRESNLFGSPIKDLALAIENTRLAPVVDEFRAELERMGLSKIAPGFYLSSEWGVPFGTVGIAIPFYLARPELTELHGEEVGHIEGFDRADILRYLRHEMGHVVNYAYKLYDDEAWVKLLLDHAAVSRGLSTAAVQPPLRAPLAGLVRAEASGRGLGRNVRGVDDAGPRLARRLRELSDRAREARVLRSESQGGHRARAARDVGRARGRRERDRGHARGLLQELPERGRVRRGGPGGRPARDLRRSSGRGPRRGRGRAAARGRADPQPRAPAHGRRVSLDRALPREDAGANALSREARGRAQAGVSARRGSAGDRRRHDPRDLARDELRAPRRLFPRGGRPSPCGAGREGRRLNERGARRFLALALRAASVLPALERELRDAVQQLAILDAVGARGHRELAVLLEIAVRVDLDHEDLAGFREPEIDTAVVAHAQRPIGVERDLLEPRAQLRLEIGHDRFRAVEALARLVELRLAVHDLEAALLHAREIHLERRQRRELLVAEHADVELAALDVLLREGRVAERLVDVEHALHELLRVAHEGAHVDPDRGVHPQRLHEQRHPQVAAGLELGARCERREIRIRDVLEREQLLRQRLVFLEIYFTGAAARVRQPEQVQQPRDAHGAAEDVVAERFDEVEDQIGLRLLERDHVRDVVANRHDPRFVARFHERRFDLLHHDVRLLVAGLEVGEDRDVHELGCRRPLRLQRVAVARRARHCANDASVPNCARRRDILCFRAQAS